MKTLKILGSGCPKCRKLAERTEDAARKIGLEFQLEKVTDVDKILAYGVMMTPALVINENLKFSGRLPMVDELVDILKEDQS